MSDTLNQPVEPTITFTQIPPNQQVPGNFIEVDANYENIGLLEFPARNLLIGQGITAGTATVGVIYPIYRADQGAALFGAGSPLADAIASYFLANPGIPLDAVNVGAPTGSPTKATGTITFTGAATSVGSQAIAVAGNRIVFTISPGDSPTAMATNFIAAAGEIYNAQNLPGVFSSAAGVVTFTAHQFGVTGNEYDIRANPARSDTTVPGVTVVCVPTAGGTGQPSIAGVLSAIATTWYTDICCIFTDIAQTVPELVAALAERYGAMQGVDSTAWICWDGTQGMLATNVTGVNSQFLVALGITNAQQPTWVWSASLMAVASMALTNDPARQLRTLALPGVIAPALGDRMFQPEQQALIVDGIATFDVDPSDNVIMQRAVTTYTESPLGVPDASWQDIMTAKVLTRIRWDWKNYIALVYPRNKLADDGTIAAEYDPAVVTPKRLKASWAARCLLYEKAGWIENSAVTAAASVFVRDPNNRNQVDAQLQIQIIGNLMITEQQLLFAAA